MAVCKLSRCIYTLINSRYLLQVMLNTFPAWDDNHWLWLAVAAPWAPNGPCPYVHAHLKRPHYGNSPLVPQTLHYHRLVGGRVLELRCSLSHSLDLTQHGHDDSLITIQYNNYYVGDRQCSFSIQSEILWAILQLVLTNRPYIHWSVLTIHSMPWEERRWHCTSTSQADCTSVPCLHVTHMYWADAWLDLVTVTCHRSQCRS